MTAPIRARIELPQLDGRIDVLPTGWRYEIVDTRRRPGLDVLEAGVEGTQQVALRVACYRLQIRAVAP